MRVYLSVRINAGGYQDRANNVRFAVNPMLINTGLTPFGSPGNIRAGPNQSHFQAASSLPKVLRTQTGGDGAAVILFSFCDNFVTPQTAINENRRAVGRVGYSYWKDDNTVCFSPTQAMHIQFLAHEKPIHRSLYWVAYL
jgi:hypothetical protein